MKNSTKIITSPFKMKSINNYDNKITHYVEELTGTGFLALRDIPEIINSLVKKNSIGLDFGCGAGRSTRFLKKLGLEVDGIDINKQMIQTAKKIDPSINYYLIESHSELENFKKYNFIFNLFVLFEIGCKEIMSNYLSALNKILTDDGVLISIVNSEFLFNKKWLSVENNFDQNKNLKSGSIAKIKLPLMGNIEIFDYYWSETDYLNFFKEAGFKTIKIYKPLGTSHDSYKWIDEFRYPPYTIYICFKTAGV